MRLYPWHHSGEWVREFEGREWRVGPVRVYVYGAQRANGMVGARVAIASNDVNPADHLTPGQARQLGVALSEAAAEAEAMPSGW